MPGTRGILAVAVVLLGAGGWAVFERTRQASEPRTLEIVASGEIRARMRRCGCQGEPDAKKPVKPVIITTCSCKKKGPKNETPIDLGSLPERSAFQAAIGKDLLVVDSGDLFFPHLDPMDYERPEWQRRAELASELLGRLDLAAFEPGELDLALGRSTLEGLAKSAKFAFVSANLIDAKTKQPIFAPSVAVTKRGVKVGVVGVFDPPRTDALRALLGREGLEVGDAAAAAKAEAERLRGEGCSVLLLLAHAPDPVARAVGAGFDVVIEAHGEVASSATEEIEDGTAYVMPWPGGGAPIRLKLAVVPGARGVVEEPELVQARAWIGRLRGQLEAESRERERVSPERAREIDEDLVRLAGEIKQREGALPKVPRHLLTTQAFALLAAEWMKGRDPAILAAIERFKEDVSKLGLDPEVAKKLEAPGVTPKGRPHAFAGEVACATCHKPQAENWLTTKHSHAWADLEKSESQKDPECVRCHSIGFRQPGGFAEPRRVEHDGRDYRNVQCESCHGARLAHTDDPRGSGVGVHFPQLEDCRRCHDPEHDPSFDASKYAKATTGPSRICVKGLP